MARVSSRLLAHLLNEIKKVAEMMWPTLFYFIHLRCWVLLLLPLQVEYQMVLHSDCCGLCVLVTLQELLVVRVTAYSPPAAALRKIFAAPRHVWVMSHKSSPRGSGSQSERRGPLGGTVGSHERPTAQQVASLLSSPLWLDTNDPSRLQQWENKIQIYRALFSCHC